jgi:hypothetical protein
MDIQTAKEKQSTFVTLPSPWPSPYSCVSVETHCRRLLECILEALRVRPLVDLVLGYVADWGQGEAYLPWLQDVLNHACFYSSWVKENALKTSYYRFGFRAESDGKLTCWVRHRSFVHGRGCTNKMKYPRTSPALTQFEMFENEWGSSDLSMCDEEDNYDRVLDDIAVVHPRRTVLLRWHGGTFEIMVGSLVFDAMGRLEQLVVDRKQKIFKSKWDNELPTVQPRCGHPLQEQSCIPFFGRYVQPHLKTVEDVNKQATSILDQGMCCDECNPWHTECRSYMTFGDAFRRFASDSNEFIVFR